MSSPRGACCAVWSPLMWFMGRGQVGLRPEETTHRQSKNPVCQSLHAPDQKSTGIAWDLQMATGFSSIGCALEYNTSICVVICFFVVFFLPFLKKDTEHTSSWPSIDLPWIKTEEGKKFLICVFYGLASHSVILERLASFSGVGHIVSDQRQEADLSSETGLYWQTSLYFWLQLEHLTHWHPHLAMPILLQNQLILLPQSSPQKWGTEKNSL